MLSSRGVASPQEFIDVERVVVGIEGNYWPYSHLNSGTTCPGKAILSQVVREFGYRL